MSKLLSVLWFVVCNSVIAQSAYVASGKFANIVLITVKWWCNTRQMLQHFYSYLLLRNIIKANYNYLFYNTLIVFDIREALAQRNLQHSLWYRISSSTKFHVFRGHAEQLTWKSNWANATSSLLRRPSFFCSFQIHAQIQSTPGLVGGLVRDNEAGNEATVESAFVRPLVSRGSMKD